MGSEKNCIATNCGKIAPQKQRQKKKNQLRLKKKVKLFYF